LQLKSLSILISVNLPQLVGRYMSYVL
jgi:hypothetical protein